jgi:hypothetical protein
VETEALAAMEVQVSFSATTYVLHLLEMHKAPDLGKDVMLYGNPFELRSWSVETDCF